MDRSLVAVRAISPDEAAVVERALAVAGSVPELAASIESLQVVGHCGCGCASVDFSVLPQGQVPSIVADAIGTSATGEELGVIIWANAGQLHSLEVYSYGDTPAPLPVVASISSYGGTSSAA
jgi:hypothetical protein